MAAALEAAEHLRETDPERWATLCRMHLSFLLDLKDDDFEAVFGAKPCDLRSSRKMLVPFIRKHKDKGLLDRSLLTRETLQQAHRLIRHLNQDENLCHEGLFRKTGKLSRQHELKMLLHSGLPLNLEDGDYSVHDCASVLKNFLADLPEPLLTEAHYLAHCQIPGLCPSHLEGSAREVAVKRQVQSLQLLFQLLPPENHSLLQDLLLLLNRVAQHKEENRMDAQNLGTVFAPHILCPRKMAAIDLQINSRNLTMAVALMVQHANVLFDVPDNVAHDALIYWKRAQKQKAASAENIKDTRINGDDIDEVNTCITFCDRELASRVDTSSTTALALAELYAYIQTMPDSAKKNKYVKKFEKENAASSPCIPTKIKHNRTRSLGTSIKKHLFRHRNQATPCDTPSSSVEKTTKKGKESLCSAESNLSASLSSSLGDGLERRQACVAAPYLRSPTIPESALFLASATSLPDNFAWSPVNTSSVEEPGVVAFVDSPIVARRRPLCNSADQSKSQTDDGSPCRIAEATANLEEHCEQHKSTSPWRWDNPKAWLASCFNQNSKVAGKVEAALCSCRPAAKAKTPTLTLYRRLDVDLVPTKLWAEKKNTGSDATCKPPIPPSIKVTRQSTAMRQPKLLLRTCRSNSAGKLTISNRAAATVVCRSISAVEIGLNVSKETCV